MTNKKLMRVASSHDESIDYRSSVIRVRQIMMVLAVVTVVMCLMMTTVFAAGEIEQNVKTGLKQVYSIITAIVVPIAVVSIAFSVFKIFTGGEKGMQAAKMIILYTAVGLIIVYLAPVAIKQVSTWISPDMTVFD